VTKNLHKIINKYINHASLAFNSYNLILATSISAFFGFIFWIVIAHRFKTSSVGLATTLLSLSSLISLLGLSGFDTTFIRFLPKSKDRNGQINSGLAISAIVSCIISIIFCLFIPLLAPRLNFIWHNIFYVTSFILVTILTTWNTLTNSIFIAYQNTSYVFIINFVFSFIRMCSPFLVSHGGPMTIFVITGISQAINVILSFFILSRKFSYTPSLNLVKRPLKEMLYYSISAYSANILNLIPDSILPIIVLDKLGPDSAAYFYVAFTVANIVYTIAFSTSQVLLAEASHHERSLNSLVKKGFKIESRLLVPVIILLLFICPFILHLFGQRYQNNATTLLRLMLISGLAIMIYSLMNFIFKYMKILKGMVLMTLVNAVSIITISLFLTKFGLSGIGISWLSGSVIAVIVGLIFFYKQKNKMEVRE
jgi:O-antigen/teichoic acid export membrane protein